MIRWAHFGAGIAMLAGCGGGAGSSGFELPQNGGQVGRSFAAPAARVLLDGSPFAPVDSVPVTLRFTSATTVQVTVAGSTTQLVLDPNGAYFDATGDIALFVANQFATDPQAQHMAYFQLGRTDPGLNDYLHFFVDGDRTGTLPTTGGAVYSGSLGMVDGSDADNLGRIFLNVDFAGGTVDGQLSGALPADINARFDVAPASLSGGGFTSTLTSPDVTIYASRIDGTFFGPGAPELGGSVRIDTDAGNAAGVYGAFR
jgi:hypothetical protein